MSGGRQEVIVAEGDIARATREDVEDLRRRADSAPLRRARLCAHRDLADPVHEMLIVLARNTYVRPHRHLGKTESFHVVEGQAEVVVFDAEGAITDVIQLGDYASGQAFYYRLNAPFFHTVLVRSEVVVVHETTNGPFNPEETVFAPWAPEPSDAAACRRYLNELDRRVAERAAENGST